MAHFPRTNVSKTTSLVAFLIVLMSCVSSFKLQAQTDTEFWFAAPEIDSTHADSSLLRFATIEATTITISIPANPSFTPYTLSLGANSTATVSWNTFPGTGVNYKNDIENTAFDKAVNKGILITSTSPIVAYYEVKTTKNSDVFALKGKNALGKSFFACFQNRWHNKYPFFSDGDDIAELGTQDSLPLPWAPADMQYGVATNSWSSFDIVATEDNTVIQITPTNPIVANSDVLDQYGWVWDTVNKKPGIPGHAKGVPYTITLNKGQTYSARAAYKHPSRRLTGTKIEVISGGKIAITTKDDGVVAWDGNSGDANTSDKGWNCYGFDVIGDQMIPDSLIGDQYIIMRGGVRVDADNNADPDWDGESVFFIAIADGTNIYINGSTTPFATLNAGQSTTYTFAGSTPPKYIQVSSNNKFFAYHVSGLDCELAGAIIPTVGVCTGSTQLAFTRAHNKAFFVNLMVRNGAQSNFIITNSAGNVVANLVDPTKFTAVTGTDWMVYTDNDWTSKVTLGETYLIKNTLNVFHLGILNISEYTRRDSTIDVRSWDSPHKKSVTKANVLKYWNDTSYTHTRLSSSSSSQANWTLTKTGDTTIQVVFWIYDAKDRGAFYGYFSDFNEFKFGAEFSDKDSVICDGGCISLKSFGGVKYLWSRNIWPYLPSLKDTASSEITICGMPAGTYTAGVHIEGFCHDTGDAQLTFKVLAKPNATISGPNAICYNYPTATYSVPAAAGNTYIWAVTGGTITAGQSTSSIAVKWSGLGAQTVSVSVANSICSAVTGTLTVNVNTPPDVSDKTFRSCVGVPTTIDASPSGGSTPYANHKWTTTSTIVYTTNGAQASMTATSAGVSIFKYVVTDASNCMDSSTIYVQSYPNPIISGLVSPTDVCQLSTKTLTATITGNASPKPIWSASAIIPTTQLTSKTINLITTNEGIYPLRLIATDTIGCADTSDITVNIWPKPVAAVIPASNPHVCQNTDLKLEGQSYPNVVTYKWEGADVSKISPNAQTTTFRSSEARTHHLDFIVITNHSCADTLNYTVTVDENPVVSLGSDMAVCSGVLPKITSTVTMGSGSYTYDWYDANGPFDLPHSEAPTYNQTTPGIHTVYLAVTDNATSCKDADTINVTIYANPTVAPTSTEVCLNETVALNGNPSGGSGIWKTHTWSGSNVANLTSGQTTQTPTFKSSVTGPHYVTYKVTDSHDCSAQGDAIITVNELPKPIISTLTSLEVCAKANLQISVTNVPATYNYSWSGSGASSLSSTNIYNPVFNNATAGTYSLIVRVTDGKSCVGYDTINVVVNPLPTPSIKSDSLCAGSTIRLQGDSRYATHKWSGDVAGIPASEREAINPSFTSANAGINNITYTATDSKGCVDSVTLTVKVNANPDVEAGDDIGIANGDVAHLSVTPNGTGYTYEWTPKDSINGSNTVYNPTTNPLHKSTNIFWVTVQNKITLCKDSDFVSVKDTTGSLIVEVTPMPGIICKGDTAYLNIDVSGGKRPYTYIWSPTPEITYTNGDVRVRPSITTKYYVTVEDQNGASEKDSITITVNQLPVISLQDTTLCSNDSVDIIPVITPQVGASITNVLWTGTGTSGLRGVTNIANITFFAENQGSYPLTLTATDNNACKNSASMDVTVNELPVVTIAGSASETCAGITVNLSVNKVTSANISAYSWSEAVPTHLASSSGSTNSFTSNQDGDITLNVVDEHTCKGDASFHIDVNPNPASLINDTAVCQNTTLVLDGKPSGGSGNYTSHVWSGTDVTKLSATNIQTPEFTTTTPGAYSVTYQVTDSKSCIGNKTINITVNDLPTVTYSTDRDVCQGSPLEITASPSPVAAISENRWIEPGKPLQGNNTSVIIKSDTVGVKRIYYYVATNQGCNITDTLDITIMPKPTIKISPDNMQVCEGVVDTLKSSYSGGTNTPSSYVWSTSPASPIVLNATATPNVAFKKDEMGSVEVSLIYIDANTCSDTDKVTILVNPTPEINIASNNLQACQGQKLIIDANPTSIRNREYTWFDGTGLGYLDTTKGNKVEFMTSNTGTYTLIYRIRETQYSCQTTDTVTISVTPTPERRTIIEKKCQVAGGALALDATQPNASSYTWTGSRTDLLASTGTAATTISLATAGLFEYKIIETSADNCTDTSTAQITVVETPTIQIPESIDAYYNQTYTFAPVVTGTEPLAYTWSPSTVFSNPSVKNATTKELMQTTTVDVKIEESSSGLGCFSTDQSTLKIAQPLSVTLDIDKAAVCPDEGVVVTANTTGGASPKTYIWNIEGQIYTTMTPQNFMPFIPSKSSTVYVTVTDGYDTKTASTTVTLYEKPQSVVQNFDVCANDLLQLNIPINNVTYLWTGAVANRILTSTEYLTPHNPTAIQNPTFQSSIAGYYSYDVLTTTANGCVNTSKVNIHVWARPTVIVTDPVELNYNENYVYQPTVDLTNVTYEWTPGNLFVDPAIKNAQTVNLTSNSTVSLHVVETESGLGCDATVQSHIIVPSPMEVTLTAAPAEVCPGESVTLTANVVGGASSKTYTWTTDQGIFTTQTNTYTYVPTASHTASVTVDDTYFSASAQTSITVHPKPGTASLSYEVCEGESKIIDVTLPNLSYVWTLTQGGTVGSSEGLSDAYIQAPTFSNPTRGLYSYNVEVTNGFNCKNNATVTVVNNPKPKGPDVTQSICAGTVLSDVPLQVSDATTFAWIGSTALLSSTTEKQPDFGPSSNAGTYVYTVYSSNSYNCKDTTKVTIINDPTTELHISPEKLCTGASTQLSLGGTNIGTISWSSTDNQNLAYLSSTSVNNPIFTAPNTGGTYTYTITSSVQNRCPGSTTVTITVYDRPRVFVPNSIVLYKGQDSTLAVAIPANSADYVYSWTPTELVTNSSVLNTTIKPITSNYEELTLTVSSKAATGIGLVEDGCPIAPQITITVKPAMSVDLSNTTICSGDTVEFEAIVTGGGPNKVYTWTVSGQSYIDDDTFSFMPLGNTSVKVSVTDGYDTLSTTATLTYHQSPSVSIIPEISALIEGKSHFIKAVITGGSPDYIIEWSNLSNGIMSPTNKIGTNYTATNNGDQFINVKVTDLYGCIGSAEIHPVAFEMPDWPDALCAGSSYIFAYSSPNPILVIVKEGDKTYEYDGKTPLTFTNNGLVTITIYDVNDPVPLWSHDVYVSSSIYVDFKYAPDKDITIDEQVTFDNLALGEENRFISNNLVFYWDFVGDNIYTSESKEPTYQYDDTGIFNVTLIAEDTVSHCRDSVTKNLEVIVNPECDLKFPNTFTPEEKTNSDFLPGYIKGIQDKGYNLKIYSRWGQLLFETNDRKKGWDGSFKNQLCKQDVYVYQCTAVCETGEEKYINGDVTLIK